VRLDREIRLATRALGKRRLVSAVAVLSLALGIAGNTLIFSLADAFVFRPLPYPDADRIYIVGERERSGPDLAIASLTSALSTWADYRERSRTLTEWAAFQPRYVGLRGEERSVPLQAGLVTPSFFRVLGARPALGRFFEEREGVEGGPKVVVLSREYWEQSPLAGSDPLGAVLSIEGEPHEVVGVAEVGFEFLVSGMQIWLPMQIDPLSAPRDQRNVVGLARAAPGIGKVAVQAEVRAIASDIEVEHPSTHRGWTMNAINLRTEFPDPQSRAHIAIVQTALLFVLLIACANVANLLLVQAHNRRQEIALRVALGAGRFRVAGRMFGESLIIAGGGGLLGIAGSALAIRVVGLRLTTIMSHNFEPALSPRVAGFALLVTALCGIVFGMMPAAQVFREDHAQVLKSGSGSTTGRGRGAGRFMMGLIAAEVALCLVSVGAGSTLVRSFRMMRSQDPGFDKSGLLTARVLVPRVGNDDSSEEIDLLERIEERASAISGVSGAALVSGLPLNLVPPSDTFRIAGVPVELGEATPRAASVRMSPGSLATFGVALLEGRFFQASDRADAAPVVVINRALAERRFPGRSPLGERLLVRGASHEIVGVVDNVQHSLAPRRGGGAEEAIYTPFAQSRLGSAYLVLRVAGNPLERAGDLRVAVAAIDADVTLHPIETMERFASRYTVGLDVLDAVLSAFGVFAVLLASIGIYGVVALSVGDRAHEIGVRLSVGARPLQVVAMVAREGVAMSALGLAAGGLVMIPVIRVVARTLDGYGVAPPPIAFFVQVSLGLFLVTVVASVLPAMAAARVDPAKVLRAE